MIRRILQAAFLLLLSPLATAELQGPVLVFGGTSGIGLETVKLLRARDLDVTVFVRPTSNLDGLEPLGVDYAVGDALNADEVRAAFDTAEFTTVVSSLGGRRGEPRPDFVGNRNITDAAKATGVRRAVQVSSVGVGKNREDPGEDAGFFEIVLYHKTLGEDYLIASGLDYTIVRPGGLLNDEPTGNGALYEEEVMGTINRADVALLILQCLDDDATIGRIYHAIDRDKVGQTRE